MLQNIIEMPYMAQITQCEACRRYYPLRLSEPPLPNNIRLIFNPDTTKVVWICAKCDIKRIRANNQPITETSLMGQLHQCETCHNYYVFAWSDDDAGYIKYVYPTTGAYGEEKDWFCNECRIKESLS